MQREESSHTNTLEPEPHPVPTCQPLPNISELRSPPLLVQNMQLEEDAAHHETFFDTL
jgi:hypothetical protein